MQDFPELTQGQVALLRAEVMTGHVLDKECVTAVNDTQIVFTVFQNLDEAINHANNFIKERKDIEFAIYNHKNELLEYINALNEP